MPEPRGREGQLGGWVLAVGTAKIALPDWTSQHDTELIQVIANAAYAAGTLAVAEADARARGGVKPH